MSVRTRTNMADSMALAVALFASAGCRSTAGRPAAPLGMTPGSLTVTSTSFSNNGAIPVDCTCDGANQSPELTWSAPPEKTRSFAIVVDDADAPGGLFTHWIEYDIRADVLAIPAGADPSTVGATSATNDFQRPGYGGPCPPRLEIHRYAFHVFALDAMLEAPPGATREAIDAALNGHVLAEGILVGIFSH